MGVDRRKLSWITWVFVVLTVLVLVMMLMDTLHGPDGMVLPEYQHHIRADRGDSDS
ncbi:MAG: hypothetical protein V8R75_11020 [Oscillospiraceae bacterium]